MSLNIDYLHSHSGLEKILIYPKHYVIVDVKYKKLFGDEYAKTFKYNGITYCRVPTILFVKKNGVFKNFNE